MVNLDIEFQDLWYIHGYVQILGKTNKLEQNYKSKAYLQSSKAKLVYYYRWFRHVLVVKFGMMIFYAIGNNEGSVATL